jgi:hypothetical protein
VYKNYKYYRKELLKMSKWSEMPIKKKCKSKKDEVKRQNHKFFKALNNGCSLRLRRVIHGRKYLLFPKYQLTTMIWYFNPMNE